jgi:hypothetical protein
VGIFGKGENSDLRLWTNGLAKQPHLFSSMAATLNLTQESF